MKKAVLSSVLMVLCILTIAQVPKSFNYQAIPRNGSGGTYPDQDMKGRFSILEGSLTGTPVYVETFSAKTSTLGILNLQVGQGTLVSGSLAKIDWGSNSYFLKVEIDVTGGTGYVEMGTTQLLSVPYALYAQNADTADTYFENDPVFTLHPSAGISSGNISDWSEAHGWGNHALIGYVPGTRTLTINGTALDLSDNRSWSVGTVTSVGLSLPSIFSVSGSPITTSGTLNASLASQTANLIFASPDGGSGNPSFRVLVAADIPNLDWSKITSGKPTTISGYGITDAIATTGNQTIAGDKTFSSTIIGNISGNAGTVTNGVYTTGNQSINGTKSFNNIIGGSISGNAGTVTNGVYTTGNQSINGTKTFNNIIGGSISGNAGTVTNGVYTTGNQTIAGTKTFTGITTVLTPVNSTDAATKAYVDEVKAILFRTTDPSDLLAAGASVSDLLAAGVSIIDLLAAGVSIADFLAAGVSVSDLLAAGASLSDLLAAGASVSDLLAAGVSFIVLFNAGVGVGALEQNGVTSQELTDAGLIGTISDIDENSYKWVKIGTQIWMAENLKTTKYDDGTDISNLTLNADWLAEDGTAGHNGAYCWHNNDEANKTYGALYNWYAVANTSLLCPSDWHVPSDEEWTTLTTYLGGESVAGGKLKETGNVHWNSPNTGATNESGFTAFPGGRRQNGMFDNLRSYSFLWSATAYTDTWARFRGISGNDVSIYNSVMIDKNGFTVRCLKD